MSAHHRLPDLLAEHPGVGRVISSHRTSEGTVRYLRSPSGRVVLDAPGLVRRFGTVSRGARGRVHPSALDGDGGSRDLASYLGPLAELADHDVWDADVSRIVHEVVGTLVKAAAAELDGPPLPEPAPMDPPVVHLRTLARLAERTAGRPVPVCPALADHLDELCAELAVALASARRA